MEHKVKVNIFLGILYIILVALIAILIHRCNSVSDSSYNTYEEDIRILNDTIKELRKDITKYETEIERLDFEREKIRKELELIIEDNEKMDAKLINGDLDTNIKFLSDFLSKEDNLGE